MIICTDMQKVFFFPFKKSPSFGLLPFPHPVFCEHERLNHSPRYQVTWPLDYGKAYCACMETHGHTNRMKDRGELCIPKRPRVIRITKWSKTQTIMKNWPAITTHILKWTRCMHSHMWYTCIQTRDWLQNFCFLKTPHKKPLQAYLTTYSLLYVNKGLYVANCTLEMAPFLLI